MIRNIRLFAAAVSVLLCASASAQRYEGVVDKSIAVIGSELITLSDLEEQVRLSGYGRYTSGKSIRCETLEMMMESKLLLAQARIDSLVVNNDMVSAQLSQRVDMIRTNLGGDEQVEETFGKPMYKLREEWQKQIEEMTLTQQEQCPPDQARYIARIASGNYTEALKMLHAGGDRTLYFDLFVLLMRLAYQRNIREMRRWSEQLAGMGRERQKEFLMSSQRLIRENFIFNFGLEKLNRLTTEEANFAQKFARFVNERNVIGIMEELGTAQRDIEQNVNPKFVFFDFALKMIVLLIR